jgi:hypothetical protein
MLISFVVVYNCILSNQYKTNNKIVSNSRQVTNPLNNLKGDSANVYKLGEDDMQKFNSHIEYLTDKVASEVKRTQENSQYDIDRINTFLALGIGLLAIIGGLLPIFVNYFSKENLEKRMSIFENTCEDLTKTASETKADAVKAKVEAERAIESMDGIEAKVIEANKSYDKLNKELLPLKEDVQKVKEAAIKIPFIDILCFQNAVAKLASTDAMKLFLGDERSKWIVGFLESLILSIKNFDNDGLHSFEDYTDDNLKGFLNIISELRVALFLGPFRRIPDSRSFQPKIDKIVLILDKFGKCEKCDYKAHLKTVSELLSELKELVEGKTPIVTT